MIGVHAGEVPKVLPAILVCSASLNNLRACNLKASGWPGKQKIFARVGEETPGLRLLLVHWGRQRAK